MISLALVVAVAAARPVRAEPAEAAPDANAQFEIGVRLMREGVRDHDRDKIAQACDAFEASNRLEIKAGTLLQLGNCRERNHQLASAWAVYRDALVRAVDPRKRQLAADMVHALARRMSMLTIAVDDASRLDGLTITLDGAVVDLVGVEPAAPGRRRRARDLRPRGRSRRLADDHADHDRRRQGARRGAELAGGPVSLAPPRAEPIVLPPIVVVEGPPSPGWRTVRRTIALVSVKASASPASWLACSSARPPGTAVRRECGVPTRRACKPIKRTR